MKKLLLVSIFIILTLSCATGLVKDSVNYYALPSDFPGFLMKRDKRDISALVNFYLQQPGTPESVSVIALLPADYNDKFDINSPEYVRKIVYDSLSVLLGSEYRWWGGKVYYDLICDSITNIVHKEFTSKGLFELISPPIAKNTCDSIYDAFDNNTRDLWDRWFYPYNSFNDSIDDEKSIELFSKYVLKSLNADAYVIIDIYPRKMEIINVEKQKYEYRNQVFLIISIIGPEFNVLWSAQLPISKQLYYTGRILVKNKIVEDKNANEIIDYNMAREGVRRTIALLKTNKARDKFR